MGRDEKNDGNHWSWVTVTWGFTMLFSGVYVWKDFFGMLVENRIKVKNLDIQIQTIESHLKGHNKYKSQARH